ncbi:hypothetical protein [Nostoc sp.]
MYRDIRVRCGGVVWSQYCSVKTRDAMNRRLYNNQSLVETPIYRVFKIYNFHQKTLTERYWVWSDWQLRCRTTQALPHLNKRSLLIDSAVIRRGGMVNLTLALRSL